MRDAGEKRGGGVRDAGGRRGEGCGRERGGGGGLKMRREKRGGGDHLGNILSFDLCPLLRMCT